MRLTINLATRRYLNLRRLNTVLAVSLLLLAALALYLVREIAGNQAKLGQVRQQSAAASRGPAGVTPVSAEQLRVLDKKIAFANQLIEVKSLNWLAILDKLEGVVPQGVALNQVTPNLRDQTLTISGAARSFANLRSLLENMEASADFEEVFLRTQSELKVGKSQEGLRFAISCKVDYQ